MLIDNLNQLPISEFRAIIINHNTKNVTTLALLSTLKYADMPVLLIDCESSDGSFELFSTLMKEYDFDLMSAPFRTHGTTLDWLFSEIPSEYVLTVDSDIEILSKEIIIFCKRHISHPRVFASGFMNAPNIMDHPMFVNTNHYKALLMERVWLPLALFKTSSVRMALDEGLSFNAKFINNNFSRFSWMRLIKQTLIGRAFVKVIRICPFWLRQSFYGYWRPKQVVYDTGSIIYHYLRFKRFLHFVALAEPVSEEYTCHFTGSTRKYLDNNTSTATGFDDKEVINILNLKYNFVFPI